MSKLIDDLIKSLLEGLRPSVSDADMNRMYALRAGATADPKSGVGTVVPGLDFNVSDRLIAAGSAASTDEEREDVKRRCIEFLTENWKKAMLAISVASLIDCQTGIVESSGEDIEFAYRKNPGHPGVTIVRRIRGQGRDGSVEVDAPNLHAGLGLLAKAMSDPILRRSVDDVHAKVKEEVAAGKFPRCDGNDDVYVPVSPVAKIASRLSEEKRGDVCDMLAELDIDEHINHPLTCPQSLMASSAGVGAALVVSSLFNSLAKRYQKNHEAGRRKLAEEDARIARLLVEGGFPGVKLPEDGGDEPNASETANATGEKCETAKS